MASREIAFRLRDRFESAASRVFENAPRGLVAGVLIGLVVAAVLAFAGDRLANVSSKRQIFAVGVVVAGCYAFASVYREKLILIALLVLVPMLLPYYPQGITALHAGGAIGFHILPADVPLAALYALWLVDSRSSARARRSSSTAIRFFLPFLSLAALSIFYAENPTWTVYELTRWLRFLLILIYVVKRMPPRWYPIVLFGLAAAVVTQSGMGLSETIRGASFLGSGPQEDAFTRSQVGKSTITRAAGTAGHPGLLGAYLVLVLPVLFVMGFADEDRRRRWVWLPSALLGSAACVATLARAAWLGLVIALLIAAILAVHFRVLKPRLLFRLALAALLLGLVVGAAFGGLLWERLTLDFRGSVEFRSALNRASIDMIEDHPLLGVGLNNYTIVLPRYDPESTWAMQGGAGQLAAVHNLYLLVWSELGSVGLLAFLLFVAAPMLKSLLRCQAMERQHRALVAGLVAGMLGMLAAEMSQFAFWSEANLYTVPFFLGLLDVLATRAGESLPLEGGRN
jgi:hypothetical protein